MRFRSAAASDCPPPALHPGHALFLDFDGTLVELAPAPDQIRVAPGLPKLLVALENWLSGAVAIVSGRRIDDLQRYLAPFDGTVAGQHGLEIHRGDGRIQRLPPDPALVAALAAFAEFAARHDGILLEDKGTTIALHYRRVPELAGAVDALADGVVAASCGALRAIKGKMVVELVPCGVGKGTAITAILQEPPFHGRVPVFVGDDVTDEDGFGAVAALGGVSIRVGVGASTAAFRLATVADVLAWLRRGLAEAP
jgi:trehalose 6-phosphate phosphatase